MAERLPYTQKRGSFTDILRTLALIGGAGLSADPRGAPLGAMLTTGGLLMAKKQDKNKQDALNSLFTQIAQGEMKLPEARQELAERGYYTPRTAAVLQDAQNQVLSGRLRGPMVKEMMMRQPAGRPPAGPPAGRPAGPPAGPAGRPEAGTGFLEALQGIGPPPPPGENTPKIVRPVPSGPLSPEELSANIKRILDRPGGHALATIAGFGPAVNAKQNRERIAQAEAAASAAEAKLARDKARDKALSDLLRARHSPPAEGMPPVGQDRIAELGVQAVQLGAPVEVVKSIVDPTSGLSQKMTDYLYRMDINPATLDMQGEHKGLLAYVWDKVRQEESEAYVAQKRRLIGIQEAAQRGAYLNKPLGPDAKYFVDIRSGQVADPKDSLNSLNKKGGEWRILDKSTLGTVKQALNAAELLRDFKALVFGGPASENTARLLGVKPGTKIESIFGQAPDPTRANKVMGGIINRIKHTGGLKLEGLAQTLSGRQASAARRIMSAFTAIVGRTAGEGRFTDADREFFQQAFPSTGTGELRSLTDVEPMARTMFELTEQRLYDIYRRALALDGYGWPAPQPLPPIVTPEEREAQQQTRVQQTFQKPVPMHGPLRFLQPGILPAPGEKG